MRYNQTMDQDNKPTEQNSQQDKQNEPKPIGRHDETAKTDVPVFKPNGRPWVLRIFIIVIMILLLVLAGLFGWLWWKERGNDQKEDTSSQATPAEPEQTANACPENFTVYANEDLGIEFCYPTAWGKVEVDDAKFADADTGSRWLINFTDNDAAYLGLASTDWTTEVPRDYTCVDPGVTVLPAFSPFSTDWTTTDDVPTSYASRGVQVAADDYLINEEVSNLLLNGVCLHGYTVIENETYGHTSASYYADFDGTITTPQQHIDDPDALIPAASRADFATFVQSIKAYEE